MHRFETSQASSLECRSINGFSLETGSYSLDYT